MMTQTVRLSGPTLKVLKLLLESPTESRSGADISRATKIGQGTVYPLLARLELVGWLSSEWEIVDPAIEGRPRRRFYNLSGVGQSNALKAFEELQLGSGALAWTS
jgi:PadR family transcriptional regulator, regulatory protein PadR